MSTTILTKRNAHRAAVVRQITHPEYGDWHWEWRGQPLNNGFFGCNKWAHIAGVDSNSVVVGDSDLHLWEVVSWKYEVNLEELWDIACRAFDGTSFSPEERGAQYIRGYEEVLLDDLKQIPDAEQEQYIAKFRDWVRTLFDKHSRIMSAMITGPAKFPSRRNDKANNSYDKAVKEFSAWREKTQKAIARRIENAKPAEQKSEEAWQVIKRDIDTHYLPTNLYNRMETVAKRGKVELIERAIAYVRELNTQLPKPIFTERHKFFKLLEVAQNALQQSEARASKEPAQVAFEGGVVVKNFQEDRLQIIFNEKPNQDVIAKLKRNGFKWSPRFMAWQRQLTANAYFGASRAIPITTQQLEAVK